ncbi:MAG: hypothetical protein KJ601_06840 [Nanoarchaeota archaeon]|nr:hypothetical protein [Nanoarchaeota archaeon]
MDERLAKALGLTNLEVQIYLALLKEGSLTASGISTKISVHRRNVYDSMERLIEKGLVGFITRNNKRCYLAVNPERLKEIVSEKKEVLDKSISSLKAMYRAKNEEHDVSLFQGKAGLSLVLNDQIKAGKEILVISGNVKAVDILGAYMNHYDLLRKEKSIPIRIIYPEDVLIEKRLSTTVKFLSISEASPASTNIYADKVALITLSQNPFVVLIKSKEIADSYRNNF